MNLATFSEKKDTIAFSDFGATTQSKIFDMRVGLEKKFGRPLDGNIFAQAAFAFAMRITEAQPKRHRREFFASILEMCFAEYCHARHALPQIGSC